MEFMYIIETRVFVEVEVEVVVKLLVGGCGRVVGVHVWRQWSSWIWL